MSAGKNYHRRGTVCFRQVAEVIAYREDLYVWVYYDQTDDLLRYEAYVVGYDRRGEPSTLAFVVDEGILPWRTALGQHFTAQNLRSKGAKQSLWAIPRHTTEVLAKPALNVYLKLEGSEVDQLHDLFAEEELRLKRKKRAAWTRRLRALGYDVIPSVD
ncbi:MAG: hypothetical protein GX316_03170 [Firmicutes bacterium]|nr:hypothetical protein [Bacillota bacterium]